MVDAISGLQDPRRAMSVSSAQRKSFSGLVAVKKEPEPEDEEDEAWKNLPLAENVEAASPLLQKGSLEHVPAEELVPSDEISASGKASTTSATISALMVGSRRRRQSSQQAQGFGPDMHLGTDMDAATKKLEELDLYEFKESSSPATDSSTGGKGEQSAFSKAHRRHSSVPKDLPGMGEAFGIDGRRGGVAGRTERGAGRRRSTLV